MYGNVRTLHFYERFLKIKMHTFSIPEKLEYQTTDI